MLQTKLPLSWAHVGHQKGLWWVTLAGHQMPTKLLYQSPSSDGRGGEKIILEYQYTAQPYEGCYGEDHSSLTQ